MLIYYKHMSTKFGSRVSSNNGYLEISDVDGLHTALVEKNELTFNHENTHSTPDVQTSKLYFKTDGLLYRKDASGAEHEIGSSNEADLSVYALNSALNAYVPTSSLASTLAPYVPFSSMTSLLAAYVPTSGGQMTGDLTLYNGGSVVVAELNSQGVQTSFCSRNVNSQIYYTVGNRLVNYFSSNGFSSSLNTSTMSFKFNIDDKEVVSIKNDEVSISADIKHSGNTIHRIQSGTRPEDLCTPGNGLNPLQIDYIAPSLYPNRLYGGRILEIEAEPAMTAGCVVSYCISNTSTPSGCIRVTQCRVHSAGEHVISSRPVGVLLDSVSAGGMCQIAVSGICRVQVGVQCNANIGAIVRILNDGTGRVNVPSTNSNSNNIMFIGTCMELRTIYAGELVLTHIRGQSEVF